ncbi:Right handed beta helix region [uncultured archaeon]|nr:Right handed beta helix region [uncultured archaeon]
MTNYYVSAIGADSNPGTQTKPWKKCPGMTGWTGKGKIVPGDVIYFKNTDVWTGTVANYGTFLEVLAGVTYHGKTWGAQGAKATITGACTGDAGDLVTLYVDHPTIPTVFDGFKLTPNKNATGLSFDWGLSSRMTNQVGAVKRIQNCLVDGIGQTSPGANCYGFNISPYDGKTVKNVEIIDNIVKNCQRDGIYLYPGNESLPDLVSDVIVRGNECYLNGRSSTSTGSGIKLKNHVLRALVEYNYVHDNYGGGIAFDSAPGVAVGPEDCTIRYNLVMNGKSMSNKWNSAFSFASDNGNMSLSAWIYGNIFWSPAFENGILLTSDIGNMPISLKIYNNIIQGGNGPAFLNTSNNINAMIDLSNNILLANLGQNVFYDEHNIVTTHKSNIYWRADGGNLVVINNGQTTYKASNLADWETTAFSTNPNFKNANILPTGFLANPWRPNTDGLAILSGNAIGHGTNLGSPYDGSINSILRGTVWDIGAYET